MSYQSQAENIYSPLQTPTIPGSPDTKERRVRSEKRAGEGEFEEFYQTDKKICVPSPKRAKLTLCVTCVFPG